MEKKTPHWWVLYATIPAMMVLLVGESQMTYTATMHQIAQIGIVVISFGWMAFWIQANRTGIEREEFDRSIRSAEPISTTRHAEQELVFFLDGEPREKRALALGPDPNPAR